VALKPNRPIIPPDRHAEENVVVRDVPAAALTAYSLSEDRVKTLQAGFEMHLSKPIDSMKLASAVKALRRRR
jgi:CheY-like chemotaxis protein